MRSSALLVALSVGTLARASHIPKGVKRDDISNAVDCSGEIYNNICCVNGEWSGAVISSITSALPSRVSNAASSVSSYYSAHSSFIDGGISTAASVGAQWYTSHSASLQSDVSSFSTWVSQHSSSLQNDYSSAKPFISSLSTAIANAEAIITPLPNPWKRNTIVVPLSSIRNDWENNVQPEIDGVENNMQPEINDVKNSVASIVATYVPPDVIINKRSVTVVSQGLTCHGQAAITLTASNAASQIASATSAAKGTRYYANGSSGTLAPSATSTSTSTAGAAMITRGPMLAVGGAAVALAFAAM